MCCHPFILAEPLDLPYGSTDGRIISACGKMLVLHKMLRELRKGGHKVLIFSQVRRLYYCTFLLPGAVSSFKTAH